MRMDSFENFSRLLDADELDSFFSGPSEGNARKLLGSATSRAIYWPDRFHRLDGPACTARAEISRADSSADADLRVTITYLDGHGRPLHQVDFYGEPDSLWRVSNCVVLDNSAGQSGRSCHSTQQTQHINP
jgi:hypothetical protein